MFVPNVRNSEQFNLKPMGRKVRKAMNTNEISVITNNTNLAVASEMVKNLNAIAAAIGTKSLEYAYILATNAAVSSAFVREMVSNGFCTIEKYTTKNFAEYCEKNFSMSKSTVYDLVRVGSLISKDGKSFIFKWWKTALSKPVYEISVTGTPFIARYEENAEMMEKYKGRMFTVSAISIIARLEENIAVQLMRDEEITPTSTAAELRAIVKQYKGAEIDEKTGEIISKAVVEKPKKEKTDSTENSENNPENCIEFQWEIADGIVKTLRIPVEVAKQYIID